MIVAAGVYEYARTSLPEGIGSWGEAAAWSAGAFIAVRWTLKRLFDALVNYVTSGVKEMTERMLK